MSYMRDVITCIYSMRTEVAHQIYNTAGFTLTLGHNLEFLDENYHPLFLECLAMESAKIGNSHALKITLAVADNVSGFEVNRLFHKVKTAAYIAAENGHIECVKILRRYGALKEYKVKYRGCHSIIDAALTNGYKYA